MDRLGARARLLTATAPALLLLVAARDSPLPPIREARWAAPEARFAVLSREPAECLALPRDPAARRSVEIGRAAFRTPLLLGGQAARAGLSCAACHRNGRGNPDFLFPGLSGAPGTADVTSSLMSSHRGDGDANPKPIPDLGGAPERLKVSRQGQMLERFIRGLVVEEFDGPEPPRAVLQGLADYVRAMRPEACRQGERRIRLADRLDGAERAARLAGDAEPETARLLLAAARSTLGGIDERFRLPGLEADRAVLKQADDELRAVRAGSASLENWLKRWPERRRRLLGDEPRSLYASPVLRRALRS